VTLEPRSKLADAVLPHLTAHPGPRENGTPEQAARSPQPHVAGENAERARENRGRRANLAAFDQQARRDTRKIFRHERAEGQRDKDQHDYAALPACCFSAPSGT